MAKGDVDIVVGTHALLGDKVRFRDLGLVVVDEEQHFGVVHKEKLKQLRAEVHMLAMTATPIPRTLQMALGGLKELSIIATPPVDRLAVRAFVLPTDPVVLREAILREHYRGGQTFYVCPRIEDQGKLAEQLRELVPEVRIAVAHGRLPARQLEDVMSVLRPPGRPAGDHQHHRVRAGRAHRQHPDRAPPDRFGLSQLYQLRGRIGRGKVRGYAYFTLPPKQKLRETAERRLHVIQSLDELGAGFQLASHDLDIRGAGNLLGEEQSGHIKEVGFELYNHLLEEAVMLARKEGGAAVPEEAEDWSPQITIDAAALIPESYIEDIDLRLQMYRRLAALESPDDIEAFAAELIDRFGPLPAETEQLLQLVDQAAVQAGRGRQGRGRPKGVLLAFHDNRFARRSAWSASSPSTPRPCACAPTTARGQRRDQGPGGPPQARARPGPGTRPARGVIGSWLCLAREASLRSGGKRTWRKFSSGRRRSTTRTCWRGPSGRQPSARRTARSARCGASDRRAGGDGREAAPRAQESLRILLAHLLNGRLSPSGAPQLGRPSPSSAIRSALLEENPSLRQFWRRRGACIRGRFDWPRSRPGCRGSLPARAALRGGADSGRRSGRAGSLIVAA